MHHAKVPEPLGKVAPRDARAIAVQHRFNKQPVVPRRHPNMACPPGKQRFNTLSLVISKCVATGYEEVNNGETSIVANWRNG